MTRLALSAAAALLASCSPNDSDTLPPLPAIEEAALDYSNCVHQAAQSLAAQQGNVDRLARQAVSSCRTERTKALEMKAVPVAFRTQAEFDETHMGLARQAIAAQRKPAD